MQFTQSLGIFMTLVYSSPRVLRTQGKIRNLSNMYDRLFSTEPCVTFVYSELETYIKPCQISMMENFIHDLVKPQHIQNPRHIQNTAKYLSRNILFKTLCNPDIFRTFSTFRTLVYLEIRAYSEPCRVSKTEHFINNLCNYSRSRGPIYSKLSHIQNRCVSYSLMYQLFFRTTEVLLYRPIKIFFFSHSLVHELNGSS